MSVERDAGVAAFEQGDFATAITQLEAATRQDPGDFQAHLYLGAAYGQSDRQMDAVNMLTQAVTIEPANAKARYNLGIAMEKAGYKEQAIAVLQQAIQLQPDYAKAQEALQRLNGAPSTSQQYAAPSTPVAMSDYNQSSATNQPGSYPGAQNSTPVETGSPLPTNRPWPVQPAQTSTPSPYPAQQTYQGQQPYPQQQASYGTQPTQPAAGLGGYQTVQPGQQTYQQQGAAVYGGPPTSAYSPQPYANAALKNNSGTKGPVPADVASMPWNWGAFYFNWIWLCAHKMVGAGIGLFIGNFVLSILMSFIPYGRVLLFLGYLGVMIYLGSNGNKLGWQNRQFDSSDHFRTVQKIWAKWALGFFIGSIILGILLGVLLTIMGAAFLSAMGSSGHSYPGYPR